MTTSQQPRIWLIAALTVLSAKGASAALPMPLEGNRFCGPQCVQRVLEHYGHQVDLLALVKEIQWPDPEQGSTMGSLESALVSRGIFTRAVEIPAGAQMVHWPHPAIVHLQAGDSYHFVVWLPAGERAHASLWDPAQSDLPFASNFHQLRTGAVLLTSTTEISPDGLIAETVRPRYSWTVQAIALGVAGFLVGLVAGRLI